MSSYNDKWKEEYFKLMFQTIENKDNEKKAKKLLLENHPDKLYKYRYISEPIKCNYIGKECPNINDNSIKSLIDDTIWLSRPDLFNDPYDSAANINADIIIKGIINKSKYLTEALKVLDKGRKLVEEFNPQSNFLSEEELFKKQKRKIENDTKERIERWRKRISVGSLSEDKYNILMWSHYANNHKGFCIEYSFEELIEKCPSLYPVKYENDLTSLNDYILLGNATGVILAVVSKAENWSYENEWRIIGGNKQNENGKLVRVPKPSAIYMGCYISKKMKNC